MALKRVALVVIVVAAVFVPTTTASASHRSIRLSVVPLQTAQLGSTGTTFALNYGSGPTEDNQLTFLGETSFFSSSQAGPNYGYALDYGDPFTGSTGTMEIRSGVSEYGSPNQAKWGLRLSRDQDAQLAEFSSALLPVTVKRVKPEKVGERHFAFLITVASPGLNPIVRLDEQATYGRYVLDLTVTAGSASAAEHVAPHLLRLLHHRLFLALTGRHPAGTSVKLPEEQEPGQSPGGPDLSTLILQPNDVGQSHAVNLIQEYYPAPTALSSYIMILEPAGPYYALVQQIGWWPTATEAVYGQAYSGLLLGGSGPFGEGGTVTPVDLSAVGDGASGYLITSSEGSTAAIRLANGQAGDSVVAESKTPLDASDVQSLAQTAADRLDAGVP